jgi:hypothetical protein
MRKSGTKEINDFTWENRDISLAGSKDLNLDSKMHNHVSLLDRFFLWLHANMV